jgi:hypothetical protein
MGVVRGRGLKEESTFLLYSIMPVGCCYYIIASNNVSLAQREYIPNFCLKFLKK